MAAQTLFSRRWLPMRKGARIRAVSFHALRHTAATLALEDGQPPHVVAAMLGHASVATSLRLYAHVTHASTEALVDAIDARYGPRLRAPLRGGIGPVLASETEIGSTGTKSSAEKGNRSLLSLVKTIGRSAVRT
jgi:Phage integrase family